MVIMSRGTGVTAWTSVPAAQDKHLILMLIATNASLTKGSPASFPLKLRTKR